MKPVKFGMMEGQAQDSRVEKLGKYMAKHKKVQIVKKKKSKAKREKALVKEKKAIKEKKPLPPKEKKVKREKLSEKFEVPCSKKEMFMLNSILNDKYSKACNLKKGILVRKALSLFYGEFLKDPRMFADKVACLAFHGETDDQDDPEEAEIINKLIADGELVDEDIEDE